MVDEQVINNIYPNGAGSATALRMDNEWYIENMD